MKTFQDLGLAEPILRAVQKEGYENPTPIQADVIPAMMEGKDVLGIAQTGTGKTAAFVLPLLHWIRDSKDRPVKRGCSALILAPTRELAAQINESIKTYSRFMRCSTALVVGGARPGPQIQAIARGVDIIVATPGRLMDHMNTGKVRLDFVESFILDEADQMLDMGFMPAIRKIVEVLPTDRQTVLLSATMPKPIRALAQDILIDPEEISVAPASRPIEQIEQRLMHVQKNAKRDVLVDILAAEGVERTVVFTRTKRGADRVCEHLEKAGLEAAAIHGDKSQGQRDRALQAFKKGKVPTLVATDIAARGIDIDGVTHVVNFDLPNIPEAYVHRIGRTGRAGKSGVAISLCDPTEKGLLRDIERLIGRRIGAPANGNQAPEEENRGDQARNDQGRREQGRGGQRRGGQPRGEQNRGENRRSDKPWGEKRRGGQNREDQQRGDQQRGDLQRADHRRDEPRRDEPRRDDQVRVERPRRDFDRRDMERADQTRDTAAYAERDVATAQDRPRGPKGKPHGERGGYAGKSGTQNRNHGENRNKKPQQRRASGAPAAGKPAQPAHATQAHVAQGGKPARPAKPAQSASAGKAGLDGTQGLRRK